MDKSPYDEYKCIANKVMKKLGSDLVSNAIRLKISEKLVLLNPVKTEQNDEHVTFTGLDAEGFIPPTPSLPPL